jgi:PqqD family protein of HPr-rel-A system
LASSTGGSFRLHPSLDLHWKQWDGQWVVFESVSGQTASFDAFEAAALGCFEQAALDLPTLTATMAADLGMSPGPDLEQHLQAFVDDLSVRGWLVHADRP